MSARPLTNPLPAPSAMSDGASPLSEKPNEPDLSKGVALQPSTPVSMDWLFPVLPGLAAFLAMLAVVAWPMLRWWYWEYTKPESYYGFAFFVPVLVAVMFWHLRRTLAEVPKAPAPAALAVLLPALAFLVIAQKMEMQAVMSWTFLISIVSAVWFVFGGKFVRKAAFPLGFLWLLAPLPGPVLNDMTLGVQRFSTFGAAKMLALIALHPVQQGNIIQLDNYILNVDVPCSGFKLLLTLFTFNTAFAYLTDASLARRWGLFLFSLPLSIFINSLRIALIGIVGECFGTTAATTFHDYSGLICLVICMVILFGTAKVLGCRTFAGQRIF